jgi:hypothetical protein
MEKVKLIWEFRGPAAEKTAEHHVIHLNDFSEKEKIKFEDVKIEKFSEFICAATIVIEKSHLDIVKNALKPHRGQMVK